MPFIPQSETEIQAMLDAIGVKRIEDLFDEIPHEIRPKKPLNIPEGLDENSLTKLMQRRAAQDYVNHSFIGAGAYEHFIPAPVWALASRGEFMTAYTPYQAEASQGSLQLIYEYQSLMTELMALDISNASMYDGATALAEAILMAVRLNKKSKSTTVLLLGPFSPFVRATLHSITEHQGVILKDQDAKTFQIPAHTENGAYAAVVIAQPNFLGQIVEVDDITRWAHQYQMRLIAYVNPTAMALLKPPGEWGDHGADIACGEGQPLGIPLSLGGPYFGFLCCKLADVRQMPGRIVGQTQDAEGKPAFCLTLQAREQHIRRAKATSNICTNQGLLVTAATIYMTLLGAEGLYKIAKTSYERACSLSQKLCLIKGVSLAVPGPYYCEFPLHLPVKATEFLERMAARQIQAGYPLKDLGSNFDHTILIATTEVHDEQDHALYLQAFQEVLADMTKKDHSHAFH